MKNKKIIEMLNENRIEELKIILMQELCVKESKNSSVQKGLLNLSRMTKKEMEKDRPALAGAYFQNGKTYICNGTYLVIANEEKKGLEMTTVNDVERPNFDEILKQTTPTSEITFNRDTITIAIVNKERYVKIGTWNYQTKYAKNVIDCFNKDAKLYEFENGFLIKDDEKSGILLKVRIYE